MSQDKVVVLDIDGVLNIETYVNAVFDITARAKSCGEQGRTIGNPHQQDIAMKLLRDEYGNHFCPTAINMLKWIITETDAKIVISSVWRGSGLKVMQQMWAARNLPGDVIAITPWHRLNNLNDNRPFAERAERGHEIKEWLSQNPQVTRYVIFDDDNDMLPEQQRYFLHCQSKYGLTDELAEKAIKILNA